MLSRLSLILTCVAYGFGLCATGCSQETFESSNVKFSSLNSHISNGYGESWALIVGINYMETKVPAVARNLVPQLNNAERDAKDFGTLLVDLYGYDKKNVILLTGAAATKDAIEKAQSEFKGKVKENDSLLVFFSGHGTRVENEENERGAVYAANVGFTEQGKLSGGYLRMHVDLLENIKSISAKHTLLILDCCHSGEIFRLNVHARSTDDRRAPALMEATKSIQAIASCRDRQRASDGMGVNSPFTAALLQGLRRIPARESEESAAYKRIGVNQLFSFIHPQLKNLPNGQSPDCRTLGGEDGEFSFFPANTKEASEEFQRNRITDDEFRALQAMVPGDHGNWWFEEKPWFIPSLRLMILQNAPVDRSKLQSSAIGSEELRTLAMRYREKLEKNVEVEQEESQRLLHRLRLRHFDDLRRRNSRDSKQVVEKIVKELEELADLLRASDLHLLAVGKHFLQRKSGEPESVEAVETAYDNALKKFDVDQPSELTLKSLCYADYGQFLNSVKRDYTNAASQFRNALALFGSELPSIPIAKVNLDSTSEDGPIYADGSKIGAQKSISKIEREGALVQGAIQLDNTVRIDLPKAVSISAPPAFRIFVLCSEASCWQQLNRWGKANDLLSEAFSVATGFDQDHELTVYVRNQMAWSKMVQWRFEEATREFEHANNVLLTLAQSTDDADRNKAKSKERQFEIMLGYDYNALARYLHHLHGLAMAKRFRGEWELAVVDYRKIVRMLATALENLKHDKSARLVASDVESTLLSRLVNSQERLADCNLFGNPTHPDLQEAADDYRRGLNACSFLPPDDRRDSWSLKLLYKIALSLSLPSPAQDTKLARAYCDEATKLRDKLKIRPVEPDGTLGVLSEAIVRLFNESLDPSSKAKALANLREQIHKLCDELRANMHRDQLETLLLATKVLSDQVLDDDRYHLTEDSEMLLYLCRLILPRATSTKLSFEMRSETGAYLNPYYDTVMRNKLRMKPSHVKDLLEIQWESTRNEFYAKPSEPQSVLALYLLDDKCYLLLDIPGSATKPCCLEGDYYLSALKRAGEGTADPLPLPDEIKQELVKLATIKTTPTWSRSSVDNTLAFRAPPLQVRWTDSLGKFTTFRSTRQESNGSSFALNKQIVSPTLTNVPDSQDIQSFKRPVFPQFPFYLPEGILVSTPGK